MLFNVELWTFVVPMMMLCLLIPICLVLVCTVVVLSWSVMSVVEVVGYFKPRPDMVQ